MAFERVGANERYYVLSTWARNRNRAKVIVYLFDFFNKTSGHIYPFTTSKDLVHYSSIHGVRYANQILNEMVLMQLLTKNKMKRKKDARYFPCHLEDYEAIVEECKETLSNNDT